MISISLHERTIAREKYSHFNDHNFLFNPSLYKNLINMTFRIVLRKYFIIFKVFRCENFEAFETTIYNNSLT